MIDIRCGDAYEMINTIPDHSVDLVLTDPPYELTQEKNRKMQGKYSPINSRMKKSYHELEWISTGIKKEFVEDLLFRVCKTPNAFFFCSKKQLSKYLEIAERHSVPYDILVWCKSNAIPSCNFTLKPDIEYIFFYHKGRAITGSANNKTHYFVQPIVQKEKTLYGHPTIKPLNIVKNLVIVGSSAGDTVLDPFMGSGTTGVACKELGRNFIGYEMIDKWYNVAKSRIETAEKDNTLFESVNDNGSELSLF